MKIGKATKQLPPKKSEKFETVWPLVDALKKDEWLPIECVDHRESVSLRTAAARKGYKATARGMMVYIRKETQ